jgi:hypothetical protein
LRQSVVDFTGLKQVLIRFKADGFPKVADCLVNPAFPTECDTEIVVGVGMIRFQPDGFPKLADGLFSLAFLVEGGTEVEVRNIIFLRDLERMAEKDFTVLPITKLLPRHRDAQNHRRHACALFQLSCFRNIAAAMNRR